MQNVMMRIKKIRNTLCKLEIIHTCPQIRGKKIRNIHIQVYSNLLRKYVQATASVTIGLYSYGSCFEEEFNIGGKSVVIGKYCSFANGVHYLGANHPMSIISMHPLFYNRGLFGCDVEDIKRKILRVGHGCWIGENVLITAGCAEIGNGAIVGAGAVVTHDVPPYAVVAGNPAKIIKYRFEEEEQSLLENSQWWEHTPEKLMQYYPLFNEVQKFAADFV